MKVTNIFFISTYIWFLIMLFNLIDFQAEVKLVNRNLKFQIVALLQENNPELDSNQLEIKVNKIYNVISGK